MEVKAEASEVARERVNAGDVTVVDHESDICDPEDLDLAIEWTKYN